MVAGNHSEDSYNMSEHLGGNDELLRRRGPFAVAVTLVVAMALVAVSVALPAAAVVAIVAAPYMLLRRARHYRASHPFRFAGHRPRTTRAIAARRAA
jgi:hypothetical protein